MEEKIIQASKPTEEIKSEGHRRNGACHDGHRKRLRAKWNDGVKLEKHEFLEMLLFYPITRRNTNEIAHELFDRFGSLQALLDAPEQDLMKVEGVGKETVAFLKMLAELIARYQEEHVNKSQVFHSYSALSAYLRSLFVGQSRERVYLLLFNNAGRLLLTERVGEGFATISEVSLTRINQLAVSYSATSAILAHNHPNGLWEPSVQDVRTTKRIQEALDLLGVNLVDHFVVTQAACVSILHGNDILFAE